MPVISRSAWYAVPPKAVTALVPSEVRGVAVHYTSMDADRVADHADCAGRVRGIQRFHMVTRGWNDIAYNFLFCSHGYIFEGRGWGVRSAGQGTDEGNNGYHAVCYLGGDVRERDDVTDAGREALFTLIRRAPGTEVEPHSFFSGTSCPGDELRAVIEAEGWKVAKPWPIPVPAWFWRWAVWKLNGSQSGLRPSDAPRLIPPWAWLRLAALKKARAGSLG